MRKTSETTMRTLTTRKLTATTTMETTMTTTQTTTMTTTQITTTRTTTIITTTMKTTMGTIMDCTGTVLTQKESIHARQKNLTVCPSMMFKANAIHLTRNAFPSVTNQTPAATTKSIATWKTTRSAMAGSYTSTKSTSIMSMSMSTKTSTMKSWQMSRKRRKLFVTPQTTGHNATQP